MHQFLANLSKKQKIALFLAPIFIIGIIVATFFALTYQKIAVIQNVNQYLTSATGREKFVLQRSLYQFLTRTFGEDTDPDDIFIRDGTFTEEQGSDYNTANFIIDIDSLKISYTILFAFPFDNITSANPIIDCPSFSETKYPDTYCVGMYNSTEALIQEEGNPLSKVLPIIINGTDPETKNYVHYEIRGFFDMDNNFDFSVNIMDYTGGNYEKALQLIRDEGFNPADYVINYRDDSIFKLLPYEGTNSMGDKFTLSYIYTWDGQIFFHINNYSCQNQTESEESTMSAVENLFQIHGNELSNYQNNILTFCLR